MPKNTLEIVHDWVSTTLDGNNWSAREWALKANVAPSTLQRFIKEKPWCLSATIIAKLSSVSGTFPELNAVDSSLKIKPVVIPIMGIKKGRFVATGKNHNSYGGSGPNSFAIPIQWDTMDLAGYKMGEIIVVDPDEDYKDGDVLLIKTDKKIALYEIQQHMLLTRSTKSQETYDVGLVDVLGVVMEKTWVR